MKGGFRFCFVVLVCSDVRVKESLKVIEAQSINSAQHKPLWKVLSSDKGRR